MAEDGTNEWIEYRCNWDGSRLSAIWYRKCRHVVKIDILRLGLSNTAGTVDHGLMIVREIHGPSVEFEVLTRVGIFCRLGVVSVSILEVNILTFSQTPKTPIKCESGTQMTIQSSQLLPFWVTDSKKRHRQDSTTSFALIHDYNRRFVVAFQSLEILTRTSNTTHGQCLLVLQDADSAIVLCLAPMQFPIG